MTIMIIFVLCLPCTRFTNAFLMCWHNTLIALYPSYRWKNKETNFHKDLKLPKIWNQLECQGSVIQALSDIISCLYQGDGPGPCNSSGRMYSKSRGSLKHTYFFRIPFLAISCSGSIKEQKIQQNLELGRQAPVEFSFCVPGRCISLNFMLEFSCSYSHNTISASLWSLIRDWF